MSSLAISELVVAGRAVFVVGAGVAAAATNAAPVSTWVGLLEHAIRHLRAMGSDTDQEWEDSTRAVIETAIRRRDPAGLVAAASLIVGPLRAMGDQAYANWLTASIGELSCEDGRTIDALGSLPSTLLTTNYDTLLEQRLGWESVSWSDGTRFHRVMAGDERGIGHIHGVWTDPKTLVLTEADYVEHARSESTQALLRAASTLKSLVFVGCGAGLGDPNFSRLFNWHRETFRVSAVTHYRLCLESELADLRQEHRDDNIVPVPYGSDHSSLPQFLEALVPEDRALKLQSSGVARDALEESRQEIVARVRAESIVVEHQDDLSSRDLDDLIVPPVLMSVPHYEYLKARMTDDKARRLEPLDLVTGRGVTLLVAEESSGLTTAVRWLVAKSAAAHPLLAPVIVDFRHRQPGSRPLSRLLAHEAMHVGLIERRNDPLPDMIIGVDNFTPYANKVSDAVLGELVSMVDGVAFVGCKQGDEAEVAERLRSLGCSASIVYVGRLSSQDVRSMARLASPARFENLAARVTEVMQSESLPFTPFTVSLLISIMLRGETLGSNASPTSVVDQYVSSLLGRGDPLEDSRFALDAVQREAILADLAAFFVEKRRGALTEGEVVNRFAEFFTQYGWRESPIDVLRNLVKRKVLRLSDGTVRFTRSSFLYLFSAKRALAASGFRNSLVVDPVFFAPVLRHYAALSRSDVGLLQELAQSLAKLAIAESQDPIFETMEPQLSVDQFHESFSRKLGKDADAGARDSAQLEQFDETTLDEPEPFPTDDVADLPPTVRYGVILELASTALRDSDQVADLALKRTLLMSVLDGWGAIAVAMANERAFQDFVEYLTHELQDQLEARPELEDVLKDLVRLLPIVFSTGGMATSLASRKLLVLIDELVADETFVKNDRASISAAILLLLINEPGWVVPVTALLEGRHDAWAVRKFLKELIYRYTLSDKAPASDLQGLIRLSAELISRDIRVDDEGQRRVQVQRIEQRLRIERSRPRGDQIPEPVIGDART